MIPLTAADFLTLPAPARAHDAVVGISSSGEFRDVVAVADELRGRTPVVGIVHVPGSTLTRRRRRRSCPPAARRRARHDQDLLVHARGDGARPAGAPGAGVAPRPSWTIARAADHAEPAIATAECWSQPLVERFATAGHLFVTGGGPAYPAALEAALKLKEMALVHAEGAEDWEMTSGAATMLGPTRWSSPWRPRPARAAIGEAPRARRAGAPTPRGGAGAVDRQIDAAAAPDGA